MGQKGAIRNGTEGGYVEWDRRELSRMGQKGAKQNGAEGGSAHSGMECLT